MENLDGLLSHMIQYGDNNENFTTMCGITEEDEEDCFLADFGNINATTCCDCLEMYQTILEQVTTLYP